MRLICFVVFIVIGCTPAIKDKKALGGKVYGGEFTCYTQEKMNLFFPYYSTSGYDQRILSQIFEPLFRIEEDGTIVNHLAKRYEVLSGGKVVRITLRNAIFFTEDQCFGSNDNELTAYDVKFSLDFACSGNKFNALNRLFINKIKGASSFHDRSQKSINSAGVTGIRVINDSTLEIHLNSRNANLKMLLAHPSLGIISKKAYEFYQNEIIYHPIGTGPFCLEKSRIKQTTLTRNPNYWKKDAFGNQLPFLEKINIIHSKSMQEEHHAFSKQKADIIFELPSNSLNNAFGSLVDAQNGKNLLHRFVLRKGVKMNYISFNCKSYPFNDINVRKAISFAINRRKICLEELNGEGDYKINGIVPKSSFYKPNTKKLIDFDPKLAKIYLEKAGFNSHNQFPEMTFYVNVRRGSNDDKWVKSVVKQLKEQLNIKLKINYCSLQEKHQAIANNQAKIWKTTWSADYPDADAYFNIFYGSSAPKLKKGFCGYSSVLFDSFYKKSEQAFVFEERKKLHQNLDEILMDDAAIVPIFSDDLYVIVNLRVRDFNINDTGIIDFSKIYIKAVS